jgi:histidinol-phosphatase (PHP family)
LFRDSGIRLLCWLSSSNRTIRVDNHSHIIQADITDMVASAQAKEIRQYSITEHISQFRAMRESDILGTMHATGRIFEDLKEYRREFSRVDIPQHPGLELRMGLEVDFLPQHEARIGEFVNQEEWDVLLCSVHELKGRVDVETPRPELQDPAEARSQWHEYFGLQRMALESDFIPFAVLTHPVRMAKVTNLVPEEMDDLLLDLAKAARRRGKALELNGKDLDNAPGLVRRLAMVCSKAGCSVSLGSDSHRPQEVFRNMNEGMALVEEFDLQLGK